MHVGQLERPLRLHRFGHVQESFGLSGEWSNALRVGRSRKELGVGRERPSVGKDVFGEEGGVRWGEGGDEEELLLFGVESARAKNGREARRPTVWVRALIAAERT
jgi:hypothetical protein